MTSLSAGPGWYPDPRDPRQLRYFDGHQWTEHVSGSIMPLARSADERGYPRSGLFAALSQWGILALTIFLWPVGVVLWAQAPFYKPIAASWTVLLVISVLPFLGCLTALLVAQRRRYRSAPLIAAAIVASFYLMLGLAGALTQLSR